MRADVMGKLVLRPYTIAELDQMRDALRVLCQPSARPPRRDGVTFSVTFKGGPIHGPAPTMADIEDQLRTHMINGTDPLDLIAAAAVRVVDDGVNSRQFVVDRFRNMLVEHQLSDRLSVGDLLVKLRRAIIELERFKTLNGR